MQQRQFTSWMATGFAGIGHTYSHLFAPIFFTLVPLALESHLGLSHGETVSLIVAGNLLFGFAAPLAGWLGDKWSATGMMALFYLGTGVGMVMVGLSNTPFAIAFWLGVTGLFGSIYHPVGIAWLVRVSVNTGTALGINGLFGAMGAALGSVMTGVMIGWLGWRAAYLVPGAVVLATFVAFVFALAKGWVEESKADQAPPPPVSRADTYRVIGVLAFTMVSAGLIAHALSPALPKAFALDFSDAGGGVMAVSSLVGLVYAAAGVMQIVGGRLADMLPARRVYLYGFLAQVPILLAAGWLSGSALVAMAIVMVSVNFGILPAENILVARYTPLNHRALVFGLKFVLATGIASLGVVLEGTLFDLTGGFTALFATLAGLALAGTLAITQLPGERPAEASLEPAE
jgi:FSR family fosmidomycin resistance protein-like MFS transporter